MGGNNERTRAKRKRDGERRRRPPVELVLVTQAPAHEHVKGITWTRV